MDRNTSSRRTSLIAGAFVVALSLFGAACAKDTANNAGPTGTGASDTIASSGAQTNVTKPTSGPIRTGGSLTYIVEDETSGWNPTTDRWAISGTMVGLAIYDALAARDDQGNAQPYLAKKFEASPDYKTWTITVREGIKFHDGTPLTGEAVKRMFDGHLKSGLTRPALGPVQSVEVGPDPLSVRFTMSTPWAIFPGVLTGQLGVVASPTQLDSGDEASQKPIGTGPFKFEDWKRDDHLTTKKWEGYWRKDQQGNQMPYLDQLTFKPVNDDAQRKAALVSGQAQMFHTSDGPTILTVRKEAAEGKYQVVEDNGESEEGFVMFNTSAPPFNNLNARKAIAYATDREAYVANVGGGANLAADGPFTPNSPWYVDTKFPTQNLDEARKYADAYQKETGQPLTFTLGIGGANSRKNGEFLQSQWAQAGIQAQVQVFQQDQFITDALGGKYTANLWRQFGSPDPDGDYLWWHSDNAKQALALNFARNQDPEIDAALQAGRQTDDPNKRKDAYKKLQERFTADIPYVWLDRSLWVIVADNKVRGITNGPLPDGQPSMPIGGAGFPGVHRLVQTWLAE